MTIVYKSAKPRPFSEERLGSDGTQRLDGGVSYKYDPSQLNDNQSPYMLNMCADDKGELTKRPGQSYVFTSLGAGTINGMFERLFAGFKVFCWGTKLYKQSGTNAPVDITGALTITNTKGIFFTFGNNLYYLNGNQYVYWDGVAASFANVVGYIPTVTVSRLPAGGGTSNEQINLIQPGFKDSFSGDGTATAYTLSQTNLDATAVTATVGGVAKAETTDFTVNRTTGVVTFITAPPSGTPNNVVITAYKTNNTLNNILNCTIAISYGGENDTRMFFSGNTNFKKRLFRSGVNDPSYWPANGFEDIGSSDAITAFAKHFDKLIVLKERSLYTVYYNNIAMQGFFGAAGFQPNFPTYPLNSAIGCDMPGSVQIIDNNVVFGNSDQGLFIIISTQNRDEKVVRPLSGNINGNPLRPGLLAVSKSALQAATSVDAGGKYYLCVNNMAYVWDYRLSPYNLYADILTAEESVSWFPYDTITAANWMQDSGTLYYGDNAAGRLIQFTPTLYNDFGNSINAYWRSKNFTFKAPDWLKTISEVWFTTRSAAYSAITLKYIDENGTVIDSTTVKSSSWSWANYMWSAFSWAVSQFPPTVRTKPKIKKVIYFSTQFENNLLNQNLSILSLVIRYQMIRKVK